jgi:Asp-tRNA(Asn)/Glu-tRNA(Gln) amidotransferase A subunit family amidase
MREELVMKYVGWICLVLLIVGICLSSVTAEKNEPRISPKNVSGAERVIGLEFTAIEVDSMLEDLEGNLDRFAKIRDIHVDNGIMPSVEFNPIPTGMTFDRTQREFKVSPAQQKEVPDNIEELAFWPVRDLAELVKNRRITSTELTRMYLDRLKRHGPKLECVITLTEELALEQARRADEELAAGKYRGMLHGIPYGVKDLFAVKGYKTTWGAVPFKEQVIERNAAVVERLEEAGAVLVAKLTLGALAWGDVWYGGMTRNPWDPDEGSSGSSAGSASATSAGLVAFAIGTETWGSIVSPCTRCGVTGLRPTYGRVSRAGAMALSWSMDKIGPICRTVEDCAIVFRAILGPDVEDQSVIDLPFNYNPDVDLTRLRIGYLKELFEADYDNREADEATLRVLQNLGAELIPLRLPEYPVDALAIILVSEAAAAFDELTRSGRDDLLVRQIRNAWPNVLRFSRLIPAVEYIQANRLRKLIIEEMADLDVDVYIAPSFGGNNLLLTNLTGHPCVVLPNGFNEERKPVSISFIGQLYDEATLLAVAKAYQDATDFHKQHPPLWK